MLPEERRSVDREIAGHVRSLAAFRDAELLMAYLACGSEVETRGIIEAAWARGASVALPRCTGPHVMTWYVVDSFDGMALSSFGILEPDPALHPAIDPEGVSRAVALVPGLCFDGRGYRLGYGGGYYDAFLDRFDGVSLGLCREGLMVGDLARFGAVEAHDVPVDMVATEQGVRVCGA